VEVLCRRAARIFQGHQRDCSKRWCRQRVGTISHPRRRKERKDCESSSGRDFQSRSTTGNQHPPQNDWPSSAFQDGFQGSTDVRCALIPLFRLLGQTALDNEPQGKWNTAI
jgi:hypothetical protein